MLKEILQLHFDIIKSNSIAIISVSEEFFNIVIQNFSQSPHLFDEAPLIISLRYSRNEIMNPLEMLFSKIYFIISAHFSPW